MASQKNNDINNANQLMSQAGLHSQSELGQQDGKSSKNVSVVGQVKVNITDKNNDNPNSGNNSLHGRNASFANSIHGLQGLTLNGQNIMQNNNINSIMKNQQMDQGVTGNQASLNEIQNKPSLANYMYDGMQLMSGSQDSDQNFQNHQNYMYYLNKLNDEKMSGYPQPQLYDQYYINKYAYPKGLKGSRRPEHIARFNDKKKSLYDVDTPANRKGFSGWKLTLQRPLN